MDSLNSTITTTPTSSTPTKPREVLPPHINEAMKKEEKTRGIAEKNLLIDQRLRLQRNAACKKDKF